MGSLYLRHLTIGYDGPDIIRDLSLDVGDGELLGPSGAGKSTILKTIAGLLPQKSGEVLIDGQRVDHQPADRRDTVLIFQKPLLFPYLDVWHNIAFGLKMSGAGKSTMQEKITRILDITGLKGFEQRRIHQLSGGQQQRVALARGLVLEPAILLLDEPLSSLDSELRLQMRDLIRDIQRMTGTTMLFVTHDQSEAFSISDRVCILLAGTLRQFDRPEELFYRPADLEVARFVGITNILSGRIEEGIFRAGPISCPAPGKTNGPATAVIRPEDLQIKKAATFTKHTMDNCLTGTIAETRFEGSATRITVAAAEQIFTVLCFRTDCQQGEQIALHFPPERLHLLPSEHTILH